MVHENSDDGRMYRKPLGFRQGRPLSGVMTLQNFIDGGYDVTDAKILVVVKSVGAKKTSESDPLWPHGNDLIPRQLRAKTTARSRTWSCKSRTTLPMLYSVCGALLRCLRWHQAMPPVSQTIQRQPISDKDGSPARPCCCCRLRRARSGDESVSS